MAGFRTLVREAQKPPRVIVFPPTIFKSAWAERPTSDVAIGIRLPSDYEVTLARANAADLAIRLHGEKDYEGRVAAMADGVMREFCALAMCDPNDVSQSYFDLPEDECRQKLTPEGAKCIFDEIERLQIETSPVHREADDDEMATLGEVLCEEVPLATLSAVQASRARRLIAFLYDEIFDAPEETPPEGLPER
jgi:hypothetical protein